MDFYKVFSSPIDAISWLGKLRYGNEFFCCLIIVFFAITTAYYFHKLMKVIGEIRKSKEYIDKNGLSADNFEAVNRKLEQDIFLKAPWALFVEGIPESNVGNDENKDNDNTKELSSLTKIEVLHGPAEFFNEESIYFANFKVGFYRAFPGILTGLGLLFTFIGLASGINTASDGLSRSVNNLQELQGTIGELLSGAGIAFFTSVYGLATSLIFVIISKILHHKLLTSIENFNCCIEKQVTVLTPEVIQYRLLTSSKSQEKIFGGIASDLELKFKNLLDDMLTHQDKVNNEQIEKIINSLDSVRDNIQKMSDSQVDRIGKLVDAGVERLNKVVSEQLKTLSKDLADAALGITTATDNFRTTFENINSNLDTAIGKTKEEVDVLLQSVANMATEFKNKLQDIHDLYTETEQSIRQLLNDIAKKGSDFSSELITSSKTVANNIKETSSSITETAKNISENFTLIEQAGTSFKTTLQNAGTGFLAQTKEAGEQLKQATAKAGQSITDSSASVVSASNSVIANFNKIGESGDAFGGKILGAGNSFISLAKKAGVEFTNSTKSFADNLKDTSTSVIKVAESVGVNLEKIDKAGVSFAEKINTAGNDFINDAKNAGEKFVSTTDDIVDALKTILEDCNKSQTLVSDLILKFNNSALTVGNALKSTQDLIKDLISFRTAIEDASNTVSATATSQQQTTEKISTNLTEKLKDVITNIFERTKEITEKQEAVCTAMQDFINSANSIETVTKTHFTEITNEVLAVHKALKENLKDTDEALGSAVNAMSTGLKQWIDDQNKSTTNIENATKNLSESLSKTASSLKTSFSTASEFVTKLENSSKTIADSLKGSSNALVNSANAFQNNVNKVVPQLNESISQLNQTLKEQENSQTTSGAIGA